MGFEDSKVHVIPNEHFLSVTWLVSQRGSSQLLLQYLPAAMLSTVMAVDSTTLWNGENSDTAPHYHKLCSRISSIWGNHRGQHIQSAIDKPCPGKTTFVITVSPLPGAVRMEKESAVGVINLRSPYPKA
ncbi:hypothetical protein STEG23_019754 [Scotinomys teguina]